MTINKLILAIILALLPVSAVAQFAGGGTINRYASVYPGGSTGYIQFNNGGYFGGLAVGNCLTSSGGILQPTSPPVNLTSTADAIPSNANCGFVYVTGNATDAMTIAAASSAGFTSGFATTVVNEDTSYSSITPASGTIGGLSVIYIPPTSSCSIWSDGTNYHVSACSVLPITFPTNDTTYGASMGIGNGALIYEQALASEAYQNTATGYHSGGSSSMTSASVHNTSDGYAACSGLTSGAECTGVGRSACASVTSGNNDICIGASADVNGGADNTEIAIGGAGLGSHTTVIGVSGTTTTFAAYGAPYFPNIASGALASYYTCTDPSSSPVGEQTYQASNCTTSLRATKHDITPYTTGLVDAMALKPSTFVMNVGTDGKQQIGLIAEDVESTVPDLAVYQDGKLRSVAYDRTGVVALAAIQEQQKEIDDLKAHTAFGFHKCFFGLLACAD